ncbi:Co-chaperone Hsc20 [Heliocybe sulcata]|uniref:Co-chaperone Hsc20 n=1 Tax=Heliocybe sulcata TaxID=5364 RepID=A0A5C3NLR0_9AGAM|nr:Co-chaperone Hsc20 [Heliocybe sulcata]
MFRSALRAASIRTPASRVPLVPTLCSAQRTLSLCLYRGFVSAYSPSKCPQCSAPLPTPLPACPKCQYIERVPSNAPYHELLGVETGFNPFAVDTRDLKRHFLQAQKVCHPDTWSRQPKEKQDVADHMSSLINEAYKTLLDPLRRIQYLLQQEGYEISEYDQLDDMELLVEVMDERELIDKAANQSEVDEIKSRNQEKIKATVAEIEQLVGDRDWERANQAAVRLKYLQGIHDAAQAWPNIDW